MAKRDIVVIGGSAGAIDVLMRLTARLPGDLPASVFVVVHFPQDAESVLPAILNREGELPAAHAGDLEPIRHGRIYVAPPGRHMMVRDGRVTLRRGPGENGFRPAIDPLFRSVAREYRTRVIGVVVSGTLDDGTAGLAAIKREGGLTLVQQPDDAQAPGMPQRAIETVAVDHVVASDEIADLLVRLVAEDVADAPAIQPGDAPAAMEGTGAGPPLTCPDCHGVLDEKHEAGVLRYECQVGHAYTVESADAAQANSTERALWAAVRAMRERVELTRRLAQRSRRQGYDNAADRFDLRVKRLEADATALERLVVNPEER